jgi:hypothetical protein
MIIIRINSHLKNQSKLIHNFGAKVRNKSKSVVKKFRKNLVRINHRIQLRISPNKNLVFQACAVKQGSRNSYTLVIAPHSAIRENDKFGGSTKDIWAMVEDLQALDISIRFLWISREDLESIAGCKASAEIEDDIRFASSVIFTIPGAHRRIIRYLSRINSKLIYRAHNPEYLHRIQWAISSEGLLFGRYLFRAVVGLISDYYAIRRCQNVLVQSDWESQLYWQRIAIWTRAKTKIQTYTYNSPSYITEHLKANRSGIVVVGAAAKGTKISELDASFLANLTLIEKSFRQKNIDIESIGYLGLSKGFLKDNWVENPLNSLTAAAAIVVPSSRGYGMKTKILDALNLNQGVIVSRTLWLRLPESFRESVVAVSSWKDLGPEIFEASIKKASKPDVLAIERLEVLNKCIERAA